jgi:hypothetical protein
MNEIEDTRRGRKGIFAIIYENFISENLKGKFRYIPVILAKWLVGFFSGLVIGIFAYYYWDVLLGKKQFDWTIVVSLLGGLGATITVIFLYVEKFMKLSLSKAQYHILEKKDANAEYISDKLAKELLPFLNKKLFQSDTIYEMRAKHYAEEKECIACEYRKLLDNRIDSLISADQLNSESIIDEIIIILDSGTTIANIFEQLGKESYAEGAQHWTKKDFVKFYTNSIRGVLCLFKYRDQYSRYSEIPFKCNMFPGKILSPYEAIADEHTVKAILDLKKSGRYIIFITTGNYLIYNSQEKKFLPIARAGFHPDVKAAGFHIADEVHIVAPLGKILMNSPTKTRKESIAQTIA